MTTPALGIVSLGNLGSFMADTPYIGRGMFLFVHLLTGLTVAKKAKLVLEIGTGWLVSTRAFIYGLNISGGHIVSCDPIRRFKEFDHPRFTFVNKTSSELAKTWNKNIDILFIDGDHGYRQVKSDYENFAPFVVKNGLIIFHDTNTPVYPGPNKVVSEIKELLKNSKNDYTSCGHHSCITVIISSDQFPGMTIIQKAKENER